MLACSQVYTEFKTVLFSTKFRFPNPDILLAFLAKSSQARKHIRHVDVDLISGPLALDLHALQALSELDLDTLTLRCDPVEGNEEDWLKSPKMAMLLRTRGVRKVTFAPVKSFCRLPGAEFLSASDPLGQKLITQLQRPAQPYRRDPNRIPVMPDSSSINPELWKSFTDFRGLEEEELPDVLMMDPLCHRHQGLLWCNCISMSALDIRDWIRLTCCARPQAEERRRS